jgi:hypothetical protein
MIVSLHVATGAAAGALLGSRPAALAAGPLLHIAGDRIPHEDIPSRRFEMACGAGGIALLALLRGPLDPATLGAISATAPDAEHLLRVPLPRGRKLFPSHRFAGWHREGSVLPAGAQLAAAAILLGLVLARR